MSEETKKIIHGFSGSCAPGENNGISYQSFSLGIFELIPRKCKCSGCTDQYKHGRVKVRIRGRTVDEKAVYEKAREIVSQLDAGTYQGPKNVRVK